MPQDYRLTSAMFSFQTEERLYCPESEVVGYKTGQSLVLELDIPLEMAMNKSEVDNFKDREMKRQKLQESGADAEILIEQMENGEQKIVELTIDDATEKVLPEALSTTSTTSPPHSRA